MSLHYRNKIEYMIRHFRKVSRYKKVHGKVFPNGVFRYDIFLGEHVVARLLIDPQQRFPDRILIGLIIGKAPFKAVDVLKHKLIEEDKGYEELAETLDRHLYQLRYKYEQRIVRAKQNRLV